MQIYQLEVPFGAAKACYYFEGNLSKDLGIEVPGLFGCMGVILICNQSYLLVHDSTSGYPQAKQVIQDFITKCNGAQCQVWTSYAEHCDQVNWLQTRNARVIEHNVATQGGLTLSYSLDGGFKAIRGQNPNNERATKVGTPKERTQQTKARFNFTRSNWKPDSSSDFCYCCNQRIRPGFIRSGKHHCRMCGNITCDACSPKMTENTDRNFPSYRHSVRERVCLTCIPINRTDRNW